jgi:hypothetical protein
MAEQALATKEFHCVNKAVASERMSFAQIVLFHFFMKTDDDPLSQLQNILNPE